jgi:hypothetical protein
MSLKIDYNPAKAETRTNVSLSESSSVFLEIYDGAESVNGDDDFVDRISLYSGALPFLAEKIGLHYRSGDRNRLFSVIEVVYHSPVPEPRWQQPLPVPQSGCKAVIPEPVLIFILDRLGQYR